MEEPQAWAPPETHSRKNEEISLVLEDLGDPVSIPSLRVHLQTKKHTARRTIFIVIRVNGKLVFGINVWANILKTFAKNKIFEFLPKKPKPKGIFKSSERSRASTARALPGESERERTTGMTLSPAAPRRL